MYELLIHDEIQEVLFYLANDRSYEDDKDVNAEVKDPPLKRPFLISGFEVDSAADNRLFSKLFVLGDPES